MDGIRSLPARSAIWKSWNETEGYPYSGDDGMIRATLMMAKETKTATVMWL